MSWEPSTLETCSKLDAYPKEDILTRKKDDAKSSQLAALGDKQYLGLRVYERPTQDSLGFDQHIRFPQGLSERRTKGKVLRVC